jgi:protein-tyrosine phosphatase
MTRAEGMTAQIYWIDRSPGRRLAILARPRGGDWLAEEIASWRSQGIDVVVSLLDPTETEELGLDQEAELSAESGLEFVTIPVADRGVPVSSDQFAKLVARLSESLSGGKAVGVHCRAGIGRSSILVATLLVASGMNPDEALNLIQSARGCAVPDTPEQRKWIERFAERLAAKVV